LEKRKPHPFGVFGIVNEEMVKISQTIKVEKEDLDRVRKFHQKEIQRAQSEERDPPTMSDTIRMLIRKGLQTPDKP
jgi:hypothetical protein